MTPEAEHFLAERVDSVQHLEVLLLLQRHADRWWTARGVADDIGGDAGSVARTLDDLCAQNLLDVRVAQDVLFKFAPRPRDTAALRDVADAYRSRRMVVLQFLSRRLESARDFADAFRLRRRKGSASG